MWAALMRLREPRLAEGKRGDLMALPAPLSVGTNSLRHPIPVDIASLANCVAQIAPGFVHNCATTAMGGAL